MNEPATTTQPEPALDLKRMIAERVHLADHGLEHAGDKVASENTESAIVTLNDRRLRLLITHNVTFELKEA